MSKLAQERQALPIFAARERLLQEIEENDSLVIIGETGSGKTTQIPQYLYENGFTAYGNIAVTQPRRVAAITVAQRVAQEMNVQLSQEVGFSIRFDNQSTSATKIKFLTDGMLLRELSGDRTLSKYRLIIIDEAHERTVHTDMLMALLKQVQLRRTTNTTNKQSKKRRKTLAPLKLICMSATLSASSFSQYFNSAKILYISGRLFPVQIMFSAEPQPDYLDAVLITVIQIHLFKEKGDILVFLTGQEEIEMCRSLLEEKVKLLPKEADSLLVLPLYAALPPEQQLKVFRACPPGNRKVILSTNIAETSITIQGISYVVDTGVVKIRQYQPRTGMDSLVIVPVSKAESWQRSGRAGRVSKGVCYRLYTEHTFHTLRDDAVPEILRCNLSAVVLQLKALGVDDVLGFDFMNQPPQAALVRALEQLYALKALSDTGSLTALGTQLSKFPLDPLPAKVLISSASPDFACSDEMMAVVAMLSVESGVFLSPHAQKEKAQAARMHFMVPEGDHLTYLEVYQGFKEAKNSKQWCFDNFINFRAMKKVQQIRTQLQHTLERLQLDIIRCGSNTDTVRRCLVTGFFLNTARRQADKTFRTLIDSQVVHIHPSSVIIGKPPECVLYNELVTTTRHYMRDVTAIDLQWLPELVPLFFSSVANSSQKFHLSNRAAKRLSSTEQSPS